jgi:hypothetical protein
MTQDEREQKALEEALKDCSVLDRPRRKQQLLNFHAAMTEGGVWVSRDDAKALELLTDAYCHDDIDLIDIRNRLRAKLDGNHDT